MTDLHMTTRPGYTGALNATIAERIAVIANALDIPALADKFPHLKVTHGSWRSVASPKSPEELAAYIDHTQLKADAVNADFEKLCQEAATHKFKSVCVNGCRVTQCRKLLEGTPVIAGCTIGFPLGQVSTAMKAAEAADAVRSGAGEADMVINVGRLKEKDFTYVYEDILAVRQSCDAGGIILKVIFETCLISEEDIIDACILTVAAGAAFVKTSTGFSTAGSTPEGLDVMLATVGNAAKVKASGGVRDYNTAIQYINAGVGRIGTSAGIAIVTGAPAPASAAY